MTDLNAPQNVPSEQPAASMQPLAPTAADDQGRPRYGEYRSEAGQQPGLGDRVHQRPAAGPFGQPAPFGQRPPQQRQAVQQQGAGQPGRETRLALVSVGIAAGIAALVAVVSLIGACINVSDYFTLGDALQGFGANLVNIVLWCAGAAVILISVRPLTRVRTARELLQSIGLAAMVGTGVMLVVVLLATVVRSIVEQYGSLAFIVNQGLLAPVLYGVTLTGFLTIGALVTTRLVVADSLAGASQPQSGEQLQQDAAQRTRQ